MQEKKVITIDGPAAAGKGAMSRYLADSLPGFACLDTGAVYRTIAYALDEAGFTARDLKSSRAACIDVATNCGVAIKFQPASGGKWRQAMYLNGTGIPDSCLRTREISELASACSEDPMVRMAANKAIRDAAEGMPLVVDGRDAGTVLFPDAMLKFFLWADVTERAQRRMKQDAVAGRPAKTLEETVQDLAARDARDAGRECDPLKIPGDAVWIDTGLFLEETEKRFLLGIAKARIDPGSAPIA